MCHGVIPASLGVELLLYHSEDSFIWVVCFDHPFSGIVVGQA
jgi:hypothetical protein